MLLAQLTSNLFNIKYNGIGKNGRKKKLLILLLKIICNANGELWSKGQLNRGPLRKSWK